MIDISPHHFKAVKDILLRYVPDCEVRLFGSRLLGKAKKYSDFDLVIIGKNKIENKTLVLLKEAFEESNLPFRVDVLDWHRISGSFKKIIEKQYQVIYP